MTCALAIDVGSSSVRAAVYDTAGSEVGGSAARSPYALEIRPDGSAVVDADALVALVTGCVDRALAANVAVDVVGVSCFWHSLVGVDSSRRAVTPLLTWADTRADASARVLRESLDGAAVHARTGAPLHASYLPAKLHFIATRQPETFARVDRWMSFAEYLFLALFGEPRCSLSMASATGLFDQATSQWDVELCAAIGVDRARLPVVSDAPVAGLGDSWAARWPALAATPWLPAFGDGACANIGSGCARREQIGLTIGTSAALRVVVDAGAAVGGAGLWRYAVDNRRAIVGGALNEGGGMLAWLRDLLGSHGESTGDAAIAALDPDTHGLTILPFPGGERSPGWAAGARMTISGLALNSRPVDILRATLESVAYRLKLIADQLSSVVPPGSEVIGSGGALVSSPAWAAIIADVLGRTVRLSTEPEPSCRGAALLALERIGAIGDVADVQAGTGAEFAPDPARHERYRTAVDRQQALYRTIVLTH